jgi:hypothetical protein
MAHLVACGRSTEFRGILDVTDRYPTAAVDEETNRPGTQQGLSEFRVEMTDPTPGAVTHVRSAILSKSLAVDVGYEEVSDRLGADAFEDMLGSGLAHLRVEGEMSGFGGILEKLETRRDGGLLTVSAQTSGGTQVSGQTKYTLELFSPKPLATSLRSAILSVDPRADIKLHESEALVREGLEGLRSSRPEIFETRG